MLLRPRNIVIWVISSLLSPHTDVLFLPLLLADIIRMWHTVTLVQRLFLFTLIDVILTEVIIWREGQQEAVGWDELHTETSWSGPGDNSILNFTKIILWRYDLIVLSLYTFLLSKWMILSNLKLIEQNSYSFFKHIKSLILYWWCNILDSIIYIIWIYCVSNIQHSSCL